MARKEKDFDALVEWRETLDTLPMSDTDADLDTLIEDYRRDMASMKELDIRVEKTKAEILDRCFAAGIDKYANSAVSLTVTTKTTRTIKAEKLVAQGVAPDIITKATDETQSDPYVLVYVKKTDEEKAAASEKKRAAKAAH